MDRRSARAWLAARQFRTPRATQDLRDLTRTRKQLTREITRHTQRIQKTLEDANVKLTELISSVLGTSGRAILHALIAGETDPGRLADLTQGRLKASRGELIDALTGRVTDHHRFMLKLHLEQVENLELAVRELEARADQTTFRPAIELLTTIPGVSDVTARVIVADIGDDMSRFPTAGNLNFVGRPLPAPGRKRRKATLESNSPRSAMAEDGPRLGRQSRRQQT